MENYRVTVTYANGTTMTKTVQADDEYEAVYQVEDETFPTVEAEQVNARYHTLGDVALSRRGG